MLVCVRLTFIRFFLADSIALRIACGTSLALPETWPTTAADGSPTTTNAANDMFLPPLTTLVTRLMATTWSFRLKLPASSFFFSVAMCFLDPSGERQGSARPCLKLQPRFAGRIRQGLDPAVIKIAAAIENHPL